MHNYAWPKNRNLNMLDPNVFLTLLLTQKYVGLGSCELEVLRGPVLWQLNFILSLVRFGEGSFVVHPVVDKETRTCFFSVGKGMCPW